MVNRPDSCKMCSEILSATDYSNFRISYILARKENNMVRYQAYAVSKDDPEEMICVKFSSENSYELHNVAAWDFNVDDYLLDDLENDFEIDYMSLEEHYNFWCAIDEWRNEINHQNGLQKYLSYCHTNGISENEIGLLKLTTVNIMDMYQEKNAGYTIIAEMQCGEMAIVLGERQNNPERYVTWRTFVDRRRGFDMGHYFSDFSDAYEDFEKRSHSMMENELNIMKRKCHHKKMEPER